MSSASVTSYEVDVVSHFVQMRPKEIETYTKATINKCRKHYLILSVSKFKVHVLNHYVISV